MGGAQAKQDDELNIPSARLKILGTLGSGGYADVHKAKHRTLGVVAFKKLRVAFTSINEKDA